MAAITANVHSDEPHTVSADLYPVNDTRQREFATVTVSGMRR